MRKNAIASIAMERKIGKPLHAEKTLSSNFSEEFD